MGWMCPPVYGKGKEFYEKKIATNTAKIKELEEEIAYCKEQMKDEK